MFGGQLTPTHREALHRKMNAFGRLFAGKNPGMFGGQSQNIIPAGAAAVAPNGFGANASLLQFRGSDNDPQMITASIMAQGMLVGGATGSGPMTGILSWGSGNGQNQSVEFDIGCKGTFNGRVFSPIGGTMISVPASRIDLQVRNDSNLLAQNGTGTSIGGNVIGVNVTAALAVGTKISNTRAARTIWLFNDPGAAQFTPTNQVICNIPPFATSFVVMRDSANQSISFELLGTSNQYDGPYNVAANVRCPETPISGWIDGIRITNTGSVGIERLSVLFFLSL
jgi:hypothetical protein